MDDKQAGAHPKVGTDGMPMTFEKMVENSIPPMTQMAQATLSRLLLSYVPMVDYLARLTPPPQTLASFGSGSCAHEMFLSQALPEATVHCHDVTDRYIPAYFRDTVLGPDGNIRFDLLDLERDNAALYRDAFDLVFSIQTLEHIKNYRSFLEHSTLAA